MALRKVSGKLIRERREKLLKAQPDNLTIDDVVERAGNKFTRGALSAWENEVYLPSNDNILALCKALDCSYEDISVEITDSEAAI